MNFPEHAVDTLMGNLGDWIAPGNQKARAVVEDFLSGYIEIAETLMTSAVEASTQVSNVEKAVEVILKESSVIKDLNEGYVDPRSSQEAVSYALDWAAEQVQNALTGSDEK